MAFDRVENATSHTTATAGIRRLRWVLSLQVSSAALALFKFGQEEAAKRGLLLVDTKYEFGKDAAGTIRLVDEIHTPDSSRSVLFSMQHFLIACCIVGYDWAGRQ